MNGVAYGSFFLSRGIPLVNVSLRGSFIIGENLTISNGPYYSRTGRVNQCEFNVSDDAKLIISDNVGISSSTITCQHDIYIGNHVMIGGNTAIYDTDFHSLNANNRLNSIVDKKTTKKGRVVIEDHVFIGAHSTIMKGVTIGHHSIVGACSVVTKSIPPYQIWAGNPARFLKEINQAHETVSM
ncbi:acyltransferase [Spirosoma fluminis]